MNIGELTKDFIFQEINTHGFFVYKPMYWTKQNDKLLNDLVHSNVLNVCTYKNTLNSCYMYEFPSR